MTPEMTEKTIDKTRFVPRHNDKLILTPNYKNAMDRVEKLVTMKNDVANCMGFPVLIVGHAGTGKNQAIFEVAHKMVKPVIRVNCSGDMRTSTLIGRINADAGVLSWQDGLITKAVREGYWLVLDEINSLDSDILFALHGLLDEGRLSIANNSEIIEAHPDFRLLATMNPSSYFGVKTLNQALVDRFAVIEMTFDEKIDKKMIDTLEQPDAVKISLQNVIQAIRMQYEDGEITQNFGHRTLDVTVNLAHTFSLLDSVDMAYTNKLPEHERGAVKTIMKDLTTVLDRTAKQPKGTPTEEAGLTPDQIKAGLKKKAP